MTFDKNIFSYTYAMIYTYVLMGISIENIVWWTENIKKMFVLINILLWILGNWNNL